MRRYYYQRDALRIIQAQLLIVFAISLIIGASKNVNVAGSFLVGGLICALPNIYLYRRVFAFFGASKAKQISKAFYRGEFVKFFLTAVGFIVALSIPWVVPSWLFVGFIATQGGYWLAPVIIWARSYQQN